MVESVAKKSPLVWLLAAAAALAVVAGAVFVFPLLGGRPSPQELETRALDTTLAANHRVEAALQLGDRGAAAQPHLRKLLTESQDSDVRAAAVQSLTHIGDWEDVPQLIKALDNPAPGSAAEHRKPSFGTWGGNSISILTRRRPTGRRRSRKIQSHYKWQDDYRTFHHDAPAH